MFVRRHVERVAQETASSAPLDASALRPPLVVLPIQNWGKIAERALRFALTLSPDIRAVHVHQEEEKENLEGDWARLVEGPLKQAGLAAPQLVKLSSPYRFVITPIVDYVLELARTNPDRQIAVLVPKMIESHWYHYFLHNNRATALKALLLLKGNERIVTMNIPWYLKS
jgi:hypothetical protein